MASPSASPPPTLLVASAELHGLAPELYLQGILTVLPAYPVRGVMDLAPAQLLARDAATPHRGRAAQVQRPGPHHATWIVRSVGFTSGLLKIAEDLGTAGGPRAWTETGALR